MAPPSTTRAPPSVKIPAPLSVLPAGKPTFWASQTPALQTMLSPSGLQGGRGLGAEQARVGGGGEKGGGGGAGVRTHALGRRLQRAEPPQEKECIESLEGKEKPSRVFDKRRGRGAGWAMPIRFSAQLSH